MMMSMPPNRSRAVAAGCSSAHPGNDGLPPHYADLAWPLVTDFSQRRV